eukprot:gene7513-7723_t
MDGTTFGMATPVLSAGGEPQQLQKTTQQQTYYNPKHVEADNVNNIAARPAVTKPFNEVVPEIQELIVTMLGIYSAQTHAELSKVFERFKFNCVFDLPLFFCRGSDRMRMISNLLHIGCDKVIAEPRLVTVQMLDNALGRIDLEGTISFYLRARHLPLVGGWIPHRLGPAHMTWSIVATGSDDKIISVKETTHNLPSMPQLLRALWTTALTTAAMPFSSW